MVNMDQSVLRISVDVEKNDRPFPRFGHPQRLGEYTLTRDRCVVPGREDAKYLYETALADGGKVEFDLNKGFSTFEEKEGDERLDVLLDWIVSQAPRGGPLKKDRMDQSVLRISVDVEKNDRPFPRFGQPQRLGEYTLTRDRCVVPGREDAKYLYETALADGGKVEFDLNKGFSTFEEKEGDERLDVLLDWIVSQAPRGGPLKKEQPNVSEPVTCREEFAMVVRSTLAATVGRPLRLVYSGEVDAINRGICVLLILFLLIVLFFYFFYLHIAMV
ncbi:unnamed protein product [Nippostrongylus brasiliensis]|uniref:Decapping nuclease n=1 Tax=Nippostrongylus brasiliensis TaxID=27835 RepID=A0A0N4YQG5_NIPBR|nr:unnamed protein product [Nippostrongylus brasiliensis]